jgi:hypothetical protein
MYRDAMAAVMLGRGDGAHQQAWHPPAGKPGPHVQVAASRQRRQADRPQVETGQRGLARKRRPRFAWAGRPAGWPAALCPARAARCTGRGMDGPWGRAGRGRSVAAARAAHARTLQARTFSQPAQARSSASAGQARPRAARTLPAPRRPGSSPPARARPPLRHGLRLGAARGCGAGVVGRGGGAGDAAATARQAACRTPPAAAIAGGG